MLSGAHVPRRGYLTSVCTCAIIVPEVTNMANSKYRTFRVNVWLGKELAQKLDNLCLLSRRTRSQVLRLLVQDARLEQLGVCQPKEQELV